MSDGSAKSAMCLSRVGIFCNCDSVSIAIRDRVGLVQIKRDVVALVVFMQVS